MCLGIRRHGLHDTLERSLDETQWRAYLMDDIGEELYLTLIELVVFLHLVEHHLALQFLPFFLPRDVEGEEDHRAQQEHIEHDHVSALPEHLFHGEGEDDPF